MNVEWIIFFYMAVSIAMALFDLGFAALQHVRETLFVRRNERMAQMLYEEIRRNAGFPTPEHKSELERQLKTLSGLEAFDQSMDHLEHLGKAERDRYLLGISEVFDNLAPLYMNRKELNQAYFCYIVKNWYRPEEPSPVIDRMLMLFLQGDTLYLRQNAFEAIAVQGNADTIAQAIVAIDASERFHHPRLFTETLMSFPGDKRALAERLSGLIDGLTPSMQVAATNFLRMQHMGDPQWFLDKMVDESASQEVRIACVRYFMSNPYEPAREPLMRLAASTRGGEWEFASVANTALASYPGEDTIALLKNSLSSPVWYVRFNAAKSLYDLGAQPERDLKDILDGSDRFAREMLAYRWSLEGVPLSNTEAGEEMIASC